VPFRRRGAALEVLKPAKERIGYHELQGATDVAKVSVIGIGMRSHAGVAARMFKALAERGINIQAITTSEIKISVLIDAAYTELAVRVLHSPMGSTRRETAHTASDARTATSELGLGDAPVTCRRTPADG
jgi:aspartokinase